MASWRPPLLPTFVALAVLGLVGCKQAGGDRPLARGEAVGSSLPNAAAPPRAAASGEEHDCSSHAPQLHGPQAPSATKLSASERTKVTALRVLAHGSAVIVRKEPDGWVMGGPSGCVVSSQRVEHVLDNLSSLQVVASREPPEQNDRQVVVLDGANVLVQYDVGVGVGGEDPARLPDGSVVRLRGLDRGLLSSQPSDWCEGRR